MYIMHDDNVYFSCFCRDILYFIGWVCGLIFEKKVKNRRSKKNIVCLITSS